MTTSPQLGLFRSQLAEMVLLPGRSCSCCGKALDLVALHCATCDRTMCARCIVNDWRDWMCYCGADAHDAAWNISRLRALRAAQKAVGPRYLAELKRDEERRLDERIAYGPCHGTDCECNEWVEPAKLAVSA